MADPAPAPSFFAPWAGPPAASAPQHGHPWIPRVPEHLPAFGRGFEGPFRSFMDRFLRPLADRVRPEITGLENLPQAGPAVVLLNHSGANAARDLIVFVERWAEHVGHDVRRLPGAVSLPRFRRADVLRGALGDGAVSAFALSADRHNDAVLQRGGIVLMYPENAADVLSHGARRGPVTFLPDFVARALGHGAAVIPVACLSGEAFSWNARDWHGETHETRIEIGAPLHITLDPAKATPADHEAAAAAMREIFVETLHRLHAVSEPARKPSNARRASPSAISAGPALQAGLIHDGAASGPKPRAPSEPMASAAPDSLARRVAALEAEGQVARAMFTWGRALDRVEQTKEPADAQHIADELMTPDGVMDFAAVGWGVWGPDKKSLVAEILKFSRKIGWAYHTYPNGEITVDLDQGSARYFTTTEVVPLSVGGAFQWYFLTQITDFRRIGGAWKVVRYTLRDLRVAPNMPDRW